MVSAAVFKRDWRGRRFDDCSDAEREILSEAGIEEISDYLGKLGRLAKEQRNHALERR
jgi:hypothetical protein